MTFASHPEPAPRRVIDVAVGIIVGLRGCSEEEAFNEIAHVVHRTGVPLSSTAAALVALASSGREQGSHGAEAQQLWRDLFPAGSRFGAPRR